MPNHNFHLLDERLDVIETWASDDLERAMLALDQIVESGALAEAAELDSDGTIGELAGALKQTLVRELDSAAIAMAKALRQQLRINEMLPRLHQVAIDVTDQFDADPDLVAAAGGALWNVYLYDAGQGAEAGTYTLRFLTNITPNDDKLPDAIEERLDAYCVRAAKVERIVPRATIDALPWYQRIYCAVLAKPDSADYEELLKAQINGGMWMGHVPPSPSAADMLQEVSMYIVDGLVAEAKLLLGHAHELPELQAKLPAIESIRRELSAGRDFLAKAQITALREDIQREQAAPSRIAAAVAHGADAPSM